MKKGREARVVLVTCASLKEARAIARIVVTKQLAACVNILLGPVESIYSWKGKIENAREYLLVMKTTAARLRALEREVKRLHRYDVPEFVALRVTYGSKRYLDWVRDSVREHGAAVRAGHSTAKNSSLRMADSMALTKTKAASDLGT